MSENTRILSRNAREQDIPAVAEIDAEAFSPYGTAAKPETFQLRLTAFPGRIFCIAAMAVKMKYRGRGYSLLVLDKLSLSKCGESAGKDGSGATIPVR
jgi:predicted N-acetyltransferase YhbS